MKLKDIKGLSEELIHIVCAYRKQFVFDKCKNHEQCKDIAQAIGEKELVVDEEKIRNILKNKVWDTDRGYVMMPYSQAEDLAQTIAKEFPIKVKK